MKLVIYKLCLSYLIFGFFFSYSYTSILSLSKISYFRKANQKNIENNISYIKKKFNKKNLLKKSNYVTPYLLNSSKMHFGNVLAHLPFENEYKITIGAERKEIVEGNKIKKNEKANQKKKKKIAQEVNFVKKYLEEEKEKLKELRKLEIKKKEKEEKQLDAVKYKVEQEKKSINNENEENAKEEEKSAKKLEKELEILEAKGKNDKEREYETKEKEEKIPPVFSNNETDLIKKKKSEKILKLTKEKKDKNQETQQKKKQLLFSSLVRYHSSKFPSFDSFIENTNKNKIISSKTINERNEKPNLKNNNLYFSSLDSEKTKIKSSLKILKFPDYQIRSPPSSDLKLKTNEENENMLKIFPLSFFFYTKTKIYDFLQNVLFPFIVIFVIILVIVSAIAIFKISLFPSILLKTQNCNEDKVSNFYENTFWKNDNEDEEDGKSKNSSFTSNFFKSNNYFNVEKHNKKFKKKNLLKEKWIAAYKKYIKNIKKNIKKKKPFIANGFVLSGVSKLSMKNDHFNNCTTTVHIPNVSSSVQKINSISSVSSYLYSSYNDNSPCKSAPSSPLYAINHN